ncbi:MAG: hypothetical protein B6U86_02125 [Candidatus Altiarchaeales archaeon ex4484_43]|nr:MAG: hypothetical protein B6U86_02125 [Candidatus Altiarchaeales archaeon ex4484_43]
MRSFEKKRAPEMNAFSKRLPLTKLEQRYYLVPSMPDSTELLFIGNVNLSVDKARVCRIPHPLVNWARR